MIDRELRKRNGPTQHGDEPTLGNRQTNASRI
jgi:hypothetical protein